MSKSGNEPVKMTEIKTPTPRRLLGFWATEWLPNWGPNALAHFFFPGSSGENWTACGKCIEKNNIPSRDPHAERCPECEAMLTATENWTDGDLLLREGWYSNAEGFAVAVVAVVNPGVDWVAYIGGTDLTEHEEEAVRWVAQHGAKLPARLAQAFFPDLPMQMFRQ